MKFKKKFLLLSSIIAVIFISSACSRQETKDPLIIERIEQAAKGVDIFSTLDYQIISDKKQIVNLEPAIYSKSNGDVQLLDILLRLKNDGDNVASNINVKINEPVPLNHISASTIGIKGSHLEKNNKTELRHIVAFDNKKNLASYIEKISFTISWDEDNERRHITIGF